MKPLKPRPTVRTFIAIQPDTQCVENIYRYVDSIKPLLSDGNLRWIPPQNWHITLAFLGNKTHKDLDLLTSTLSLISENHSPFTITFTHFDWFPSLFKPKVLACIAQPSEEFNALTKSIFPLIKTQGAQKREQDTLGHLSVARPKQKQVMPLDTLIDCNTETWAEGFSLFESELRPEGARYHEIAYFELKKSRHPKSKAY